METGSVVWELLLLGVSAFVSATVLPGSSEAVLAGLMTLGTVSTVSAVAVATIGNTAGSLVNWAIGRYAAGFRDHPRFPVSPERFEKTAAFFRRWGVWALALSWVPVIGDPLTIVAGVMRTPLVVFVPIVALAKLARYLVVAGAISLF
jgi:membrane protein YqaA with SNARE-associated domain